MRPDLFDESKIIKKNSNKESKEIKSEQSTIEHSKNEQFETIERPTLQEKIKEDSSNEDIQINIEQQIPKPVYNISADIDTAPLFVFGRNKYTKEINSYTNVNNTTSINFDVPEERLKIKLANVTNDIYDLKIEIEILNSLVNNCFDNNMFEFYNSKLDYYLKEYDFNLIKKNILEKALNK